MMVKQSLDFPLIYCNGDSYSDQNCRPSLKGNTYADVVANFFNGFVINSAVRGSCNRRIIRTTVYDMLEHRKLNPDQKTIALIGLSFELRGEIWADSLIPTNPKESQFVTHTFSSQINWRENLLSNIDIETPFGYDLSREFFKKYSEGRAYFFSPYAERINLLCDLIMLKKLLESLNINFLIFQSPKAEKLESDHVLDFFKEELANDERFFDLESFGFVDWACTKGFIPIDMLDRPEIGHYGPDAHYAFAVEVLIPKLKKQGII
jgi:hypothetical protein